MNYVLTLDPSFRNLGWTVFERDTHKPRGAGVICTRKEQSVVGYIQHHNSSCHLANSLNSVFTLYNPSIVAAEAVSGSRSATSGILMGRAWGVVSSIAALHKKEVIQVTAKKVKEVVCGSKSASKKEIKDAVRKHFRRLEYIINEDVPKKAQQEHAYDAASVYSYCLLVGVL